MDICLGFKVGALDAEGPGFKPCSWEWDEVFLGLAFG